MWSDCTDNDNTYALLKQQLAKAHSDPYLMQLTSQDYAVFAQAWNMGIDSHLEALTERSSVEQRGHKAHISVHPEELPVLVRRLFQLSYDEDHEEEDGPALRLAMDILHSLDIEEE
jgi:hypothetical protein